jgi:UDP:flavonoid glycosyltransferase YjiC (YdhE family)
MPALRLLLATMGTRGDLQPMLALGEALRARGHAVTFAAPPDFAAQLRGLGYPFHPCGMQVADLLRRHAAGLSSGLSFGALGAAREFPREVAAQAAALLPAAAGHDAMVCASLLFAAPMVAEKLGIPYLYCLFATVAMRSAHHPPFMLGARRLPRWLNRLGWDATVGAADLLLGPALAVERHRLGLPPPRPVFRELRSRPILLACDPQLAPAPPDFGADVIQTGAWILPPPTALPPALEAFLAAGPPPVFLGFGSMPDRDPAATTRMAISAARRARVRLVLGAGWSGLSGGTEGTAADVAVAGDVPHALLFPRCAAVVHHGGAGTTAAAARAGVPQAIVPHLLDQHHWGWQVHRLGLGPAPLARRHLDTARLAARFTVLRDPGRRARAAALATALAANPGTAQAVQVIEAAAASGRLGQPSPTRKAH